MEHKKCNFLKPEALKCLELMGVDENKIKDFAENDRIALVYVNHSDKKFQYEDMTEKLSNAVREFEREHGALVYYIIHDESRWEDDDSPLTRYMLLFLDDDYYAGSEYVRSCIKEFSTVFAYVINVEVPDYSEFGEVPFQNVNGTLIAVGNV